MKMCGKDTEGGFEGLERGRSLECCDLSQLFNVEWLSTKSGAEPPHSK
jgi:hypothetical protein